MSDLGFDRRAKSGGHWGDAYEFVRLHQPARVNSRPLEHNQAKKKKIFCIVKTERYGSNVWSVLKISQVSGGADLASKAQILAYYELVLADLEVTLINFNITNIIITIMGNPG